MTQMSRRSRPWIPAALFTVCLAGVPAPLGAQEPATGSLSGRVLDAETGQPVGAVEIVLPELERRTTTNRRGCFLLEDVPLGIHTLRVEHLGFASAEREVEVHGRFESSLTVRLRREPVELEPLVASVQRELKVRHLEREGFYERRERNWGGGVLRAPLPHPVVRHADSGARCSRCRRSCRTGRPGAEISASLSDKALRGDGVCRR